MERLITVLSGRPKVYSKKNTNHKAADRDQSSQTRLVVSEDPAAKTCTDKSKQKTTWLSRLFGRLPRKDGHAINTEKKSSDGGTSTTAPRPEEKKKKTTWWSLFSCFRRKRRVAPTCDDDVQTDGRSRKKTDVQPTDGARSSKPQHVHFQRRKKTDVQPTHGASSSRSQQVFYHGFPNTARICYMNSSLQSLLTLRDFVEDVRSQEDLFAQCHEAELMKCFVDIIRCHSSDDVLLKLQALSRLKEVVSQEAPEFRDDGNKDAHEFLVAVLVHMESLALPLRQTAAILGGSYKCPIARNFVFTMQNTRTCKRCGDRSVTQENFTNLSLNLIPELSVEQLLQIYQMETQLEYRCSCGGLTSRRKTTFLTLPKFLILHLKRFKFTENLKMMKLHDPIILLRDLMVTSHQEEGWYNLVSVISHLGSAYDGGHYVSDGLHPDENLDSKAENWLRYNDEFVYKTTGAEVRRACKNTSYVLFYQRRM